MSFVRLQKKSEDCRAYTSAASTLYTIGEAISLASATGSVQSASSNDRVLGICMQAKATSDATTGAVLVDIAHADDVFVVNVTGTMANSYLGDTADLSTSLVVALATDTYHDVVIVGWDGTTTSKAYVRFLKTVFA